MLYETVKDLPQAARTVHRIFKKQELQEIALELGIETGRKNTRKLVLEIVNDLEDKGIPETADTSDALFEFLLNIDFINDDGKLLEVSKDSKPEILPQDIKVSTKPECFSLADPRDPACKRCILLNECLDERVLVRPDCYGDLFDEESGECQNCIEFGPCREVYADGKA